MKDRRDFFDNRMRTERLEVPDRRPVLVRTLLFLCLLLLNLPVAPGYAQVEQRRFAVLVANQTFDLAGGHFEPLAYPAKDLVDLYEVLADPALGAFTDVYPIVDDEALWGVARSWPERAHVVEDILARRSRLEWAPAGMLEPVDCQTALESCQPTRANVLAFLEGVKKQADVGDEVLVYFSTHGTVLSPPDPDKPIPSGDVVLMMRDTAVETSAEGLLSILEPLTEADVLEVVNKMAAHQKAVIEDACHTAWPATVEAFLEAQNEARGAVDLRQLVTSRQTVVISGSGPSEYAYEDNLLENAVYTHFFVHALRSIAPDIREVRQREAENDADAIQALSSLADRDRDGKVSLEEARSLVAAVGRLEREGVPSSLGNPFRLLIAVAASTEQRLPLDRAVEVLTSIDRDMDGAISLEEAHSFAAAATYVYTRLAKKGAQSPVRQDWRYRDPPAFILSGRAAVADVAHLLPFPEDRLGRFDVMLMSARAGRIVVDGEAYEMTSRALPIKPGLRSLAIVDSEGVVLADARVVVRPGSSVRLQDVWALDHKQRAVWLGSGAAGWLDDTGAWTGAALRLGYCQAVFSRTRDDWALDLGGEVRWGADRGCWDTNDPGCLVGKYTIGWVAATDVLAQVRVNYPMAGVGSTAVGLFGGPFYWVSSEINITKLMVGWGPRAVFAWSPRGQWWLRAGLDARFVYGDLRGAGAAARPVVHVMGQGTIDVERRF